VGTLPPECIFSVVFTRKVVAWALFPRVDIFWSIHQEGCGVGTPYSPGRMWCGHSPPGWIFSIIFTRKFVAWALSPRVDIFWSIHQEGCGVGTLPPGWIFSVVFTRKVVAWALSPQSGYFLEYLYILRGYKYNMYTREMHQWFLFRV